MIPRCSTEIENICGVGIDAVEIRRIEKLLNRWGDKFIHRVYTREEQDYCRRKKRSIESFAVRFAAKEATLKAIGTGLSERSAWKEISVRNNSNGSPFLELAGAAGAHAAQKGIMRFELSLTHTRELAMAIVLAIGKPQSGDESHES